MSASNEHGGVPATFGTAESVPVSVATDASYGGVSYVSWTGVDVSVEGINPELVELPTEDVDQDLVERLKGVDVQVHGIYNEPQPQVGDAAVQPDDVVTENPDYDVIPVPEDVDVPAEEVVSEETPEPAPEAPAKRKPGRPRKNG